MGKSIAGHPSKFFVRNFSFKSVKISLINPGLTKCVVREGLETRTFVDSSADLTVDFVTIDMMSV